MLLHSFRRISVAGLLGLLLAFAFAPVVAESGECAARAAPAQQMDGWRKVAPPAPARVAVPRPSSETDSVAPSVVPSARGGDAPSVFDLSARHPPRAPPAA